MTGEEFDEDPMPQQLLPNKKRKSNVGLAMPQQYMHHQQMGMRPQQPMMPGMFMGPRPMMPFPGQPYGMPPFMPGMAMPGMNPYGGPGAAQMAAMPRPPAQAPAGEQVNTTWPYVVLRGRDVKQPWPPKRLRERTHSRRSGRTREASITAE